MTSKKLKNLRALVKNLEGPQAKQTKTIPEIVVDRANKMAEAKERKILNLATDRLIRDASFLDGLKTANADFIKDIKPYKPLKKKVTDRVLNLMLSDLHYGADLDGRETPFVYRATEERRRTAAIVKEVVEYKTHYRDSTELVVHLCGDIIMGRLHDLASGAPTAEQVARAIYLLRGAISQFAMSFKQVTVYCTPGNHGRIKDRHPDRAVNQKWDSLENIVYESLAMIFEPTTNVKFVIPATPYYEYELFGMRGFITHGDTVLNPGYPGKAINIAKLETQALKLISANGDYRLFGMGHVHNASATQLPNGSVVLTNGCLIPPDPYAISIGIHSTACSQQLWETVPGYMFGDHRMLNVNQVTDKDKALDAIIPPSKWENVK